MTRRYVVPGILTHEQALAVSREFMAKAGLTATRAKSAFACAVRMFGEEVPEPEASPTAEGLANRFLADTSGLPDDLQDWRAEFARDLRGLAVPVAWTPEAIEAFRARWEAITRGRS
jgi:hypothetical protein